MNKLVWAVFLTGAAQMLPAGTVDIGTSAGKVSFNGAFNLPTLTLGSDNCAGATCTLSGGKAGILSLSWSFNMPNQAMSPFTYDYSAGSGTIFTSGNPVTQFTLSDGTGDTSSGTFALTSLNNDGTTHSDGNTGIDLNGNITLTSLTYLGANSAIFQSMFNLPSALPPSVNLAFVLDVGNCTAGAQSSVCVADTVADPSARVFSLTVSTPSTATVPEPASFGLMGGGLASLAALRRRFGKAPRS